MLLVLTGCDDEPLNSPYRSGDSQNNRLNIAAIAAPKHLDPAIAYTSESYRILAQIVEPPLQYHYLKRPYELIPTTLNEVPTPVYFDRLGTKLPDNVPESQVAVSEYTLHIQPGIFYQPHPVFTRNGKNEKRELVSSDYELQIKRLADPRLSSPILPVLQEEIIGLRELAAQALVLFNANKALNKQNDFDWRTRQLSGVQVIDPYTLKIRIYGKNPQFLYWLAMPFFAPVPWEILSENKIDDYPVGTGAYQISKITSNHQIELIRNPNFHGELYPSEGEAADEAAGLLQDKGKPIPFIDQIRIQYEKENIPRWQKFLQGYYDYSGIGNEEFAQAIHLGVDGAHVSEELQEKGVRLDTSTSLSLFYWGFNMLDPQVGGFSENHRALREAIATIIDVNEFIQLFLNGRAEPANGPIPPGLLGADLAKDTTKVGDTGSRIQRAKQLLIEAGYPNGIDPNTQHPLQLHYDISSIGSPNQADELNWMVKQFKKIGIELEIRATDLNRFEEKLDQGDMQFYFYGWSADYPDPENFLMLLYGKNSRKFSKGINFSNYQNQVYDQLYSIMKLSEDKAERLSTIDQMLKILELDRPIVYGFYPIQYVLAHQWNRAIKPNDLALNSLKYRRIDVNKRHELQKVWNQPIWWPLIIILGFLGLSLAPAFWSYKKRLNTPFSRYLRDKKAEDEK